MDNLKKAKQYFEQAINFNPQSSYAYAGIGEIFYLQNHIIEAKKMFEIAFYEDPENEFARQGLIKTKRFLESINEKYCSAAS
jgi:tetratricopeptide (TPR) repeat protein